MKDKIPVAPCPNPNEELGICYSFDRYGDRLGCIGCDLFTEEMQNGKDLLPGLTKILKEMEEQE